jgi:hypothetical protein
MLELQHGGARMGLFDKLFGGNKAKETTAVIEPPPCAHAVLVARWDSVEDMGKEEKATRFMCEACHQEFTPEEAQAIRSESLRDTLIGQQEAEEA